MHLVFWCLFLMSIAHSCTCNSAKLLKTKYAWKYVDFVWESSKQKEDAIKSGEYDYKKCRPVDVDEAPDGRTFVTIASGSGSPVSVSTVTPHHGPGGPLLKPYPDWSWYNKKNCTGITGVLRVAIDKCNRLWVLDTGVKDFSKRVCPAQLLAFDLSTDKLIKRIVIPNNVAMNSTGNGLLVNPIVETRGHKCEHTTFYIADAFGGSLVVVKEDDSYRLNSKVFQFDEKNKNGEIAGTKFQASDALFGMSLSPILSNGNRYLVFSAFASKSLYATDTRTLTRHFDSSKIKYKGIDILPSLPTVQAFSSRGTLFYGLTKEVAVGCWNIHKPLKSENLGIAVADKQRLQFMSGMKVISSHQPERLLVMSDRYQIDSLNYNETNFRITEAYVKDLVEGTVCDKH